MDELSPQDGVLFLRALAIWRVEGAEAVTCDECGSPISFLAEPDAVRHACDCGKFDGTL